MFTNQMEYKVAWGDTDLAGIVYYPNYYKWMDNATHELFSAMGYPISDLIRQKIGLPLLETFCKFSDSVSYSEQIQMISKVVEVKDKTIKMSHEFRKKDKLLAEGYELRAWISFEQGMKAVSIPDHIRQALNS